MRLSAPADFGKPLLLFDVPHIVLRLLSKDPARVTGLRAPSLVEPNPFGYSLALDNFRALLVTLFTLEGENCVPVVNISVSLISQVFVCQIGSHTHAPELLVGVHSVLYKVILQRSEKFTCFHSL